MARRKKAAPRWEFDYGETHYTLDVGRDLTMGRLVQIKHWYPNLGTMSNMVAGLVQGDPEAWACAIWAARKSAGESEVTEPRRMKDFSVWDLMADDDLDEDEDETADVDAEDEPAPRPTSPPISGSSSSSTISEDDTSDC